MAGWSGTWYEGLPNAILQLPLFVLEQQQFTKGKVVGQRLLLMGETADPAPESVELASPLHWNGEPYIGIGNSAFVLAPMLIWRISKASANYKLFVFDSIQDDSVTFKAVEVSQYESNDTETIELQELLAGATRPLEDLMLDDGRSFQIEWGERRRALEQAQDKLHGRIPWQSFSQDTLTWYASKLSEEGGDMITETTTRAAQQTIHHSDEHPSHMVLPVVS